jgi:hypothetical protein
MEEQGRVFQCEPCREIIIFFAVSDASPYIAASTARADDPATRRSGQFDSGGGRDNITSRWQHGRMYTARRTRSGLGKPGPDFCEVQMTTIMTIDEPRPRGTVIGERVGGPPLD